MSLSLLGAGKAVDAAAAFNPATVSGLVGWWKADAIAGKVDGDAISSWADSSGSGHAVIMATGTKQPLYKTAIQNSLPVVRFDGVDDQLGVSFTLAQPAEVFIVAKYRSARVVNDTLFDSGPGFNNQMRLFRGAANTMSMYALGSVAPSATIDPQTLFHVYTALFSGASSELRVDGGTANTGNPGTAAPTGISFGATGSSGGEQGPVDIGEALLYSATVSAGNRAAIETYLKGKWGTP